MRVTFTAYCTRVKIAVAERFADMSTVQVVPVKVLHAPVQPPNVDVPSGAAVKVTVLPMLYEPTQLLPQSMTPSAPEEIVPPPLPLLPTASVTWVLVKLACTAFAASIVTWHGPVPTHAPDHPVKVAPVLGVADSVI